MNCLPVIEMEMRSASRRRWTFVLRLLFALAGSAACLVVLALPRLGFAQRGQTMLILLSFLSLAFCLAAGGFLTADCVSAEKRDGTLGLLFLTPLSGVDVVLGKMICHGLQTFYGVCAVFPVFFLPLLTGGVTWGEVSRILLALAVALILSASLGMVVSTLGTESRRTIMATLTSIVLLAAVPMLFLLVRGMFRPMRGTLFNLAQLSPVFTVLSAFDFSYRGAVGPRLFWGSLSAISGLSLALIIVSALLVRQVYQVAEKSNTLRRTRSVLPRLKDVFNRNPYEWIILRSADEGHSLGVFTYFAIPLFAVMLVISLTTRFWGESFSAAFFTALTMHLVTKLRFAVEATRQINTDHQTGAMELLLVTTLPENGILEGHQNALRRISRKPLFLLLGLNLVLELCVILFPDRLHMDSKVITVFSVMFIGGMALAAADFCALRWIAILKGVRTSSHVRAVLLTFSSVMVVPWIGVGLVIAFLIGTQSAPDLAAAIFSAWMALCLIYDWLVVQHCRTALQQGLRHLASEAF